MPRHEFETALTSYREGQLRVAVDRCLAILRTHPDHCPSLLLIGQATLDRGRPRRALPWLVQAARSRAPAALSALARALEALGRHGDAERMARAAVAGAPERAEWWFNLGNLLQRRHRLDDAERVYARALRLAPDMVEGHFNRGTALLRAGRLAEGWREYEWRWKRPGAPQHFHTAAPTWDGGSFDGRTLLVHSEQGLGDVMQFCRFLPEVAARAGGTGRLVVECPPPLMGLLRASFPGLVFTPKGREGDNPTPRPPFQVQAALASLPGILGVTLETVPAPVPYLAVPEGTTVPALPDGEGRTIGLVWGSSPTFKGRDAPLPDLLRALAVPGVRLVSLQVGPHAQALRALPEDARVGVIDAGAWIEAAGSDFAVTAALMQRLDLIVSVDTATAHLAGGLGRPLLLALPHLPDWRWMLGREDSPWYPTARLIRQQAPGAWGEVLARLRDAVRERFGL